MFWKAKEWPWPLKNSAQAALFKQLLDNEGIPYRLIRHGDSLWGYATEVAEGWGHVEIDEVHREAFERLWNEFQDSDIVEDDGSP